MQIKRIFTSRVAKDVSRGGGEHFAYSPVVRELIIQCGTYANKDVHRLTLDERDIDTLIDLMNEYGLIDYSDYQ